jgi:hypothetical protein
VPYNILPFAFIKVLSTAAIERSTTNPSAATTNRYPIADILSFISVVDMVFNSLSNVRLLLDIVTRPQEATTASLRLYRQQQPMLRKVCNPLFESILNHHTCTIKHLRTMVDGEYTYIYGLPCFLLDGDAVGHGIQLPIRYRT